MAGQLPKRLVEVLRLAAQGKTDKQIAQELGITAGTVATHWKRLRAHFYSSSRTEVVARVMAQEADARVLESADDRARLLYEIAERERTEEQVRLVNEQLQEVIRSREELLSVTLAAYEQRQTTMQKRLDELEVLNETVCNFGILASRGTYGASWRKTWCSEAIRGFGYSPEEVLNGDVTIFNTIAPEDFSRSLEDFNRVAEGGDRVLCTHRFITREGEKRHLLDLLALDPMDESGTGKCRMVAIDITDWVPYIQEKIAQGWPNLPLEPRDSPKTDN